MRNLKRVFAVIITVAMLASLMVPALASVSYLEEAKKLQTIGLFAGTEADLKLDEDVTRIQGLTFAIRAAGKEDEALAMTDEEVEELLAKFNDADDIPFWNGNGPKYVAYAIKNGITVGDGQGNFLPLAKISGRAFLVFLLKSGMGYADVTTQTAPDVAVEAGVLTSGQAVKYALAEDGIIRDDAAAILYGAAVNGVNADGVKFIDALIESGFVKEEDAIAAGFKEVPAPSELKVESVKAINLKQIEVVFNKEIDGAGNKNNYSIKADNSNIKIGDNTDFALQADGKTVIITLEEKANQQDTATLTVKDINSGDQKVKEESFDIEFLDLTIPSAIGAEVIGIDTIEVFFSEPMLSSTLVKKANYEVKDADGHTMYVEEVKAGKNDMSALVKLYANLEEGVVTITVKDVKDCNEFTMLKKSFDVPVYVDDEAPTVIGYKDASPTGVTLVFNDKIEYVDNETVAKGKIYHTNKNNTADALEIKDNELKITFHKNDAMPVGTAYITIEEKVFVDLWNNENDKIVVKVEVTVDKEAPYVNGDVKVVAQKVIEVPYNEDIVSDDVEVTLLNNKGEEVNNKATPTVKDGSVLVLTFAYDLFGDYTVVIDGVKDKADNKAGKASLSFHVDDETAPEAGNFDAKLYNAGKSDQLIVIDFKEAMDIATITDKTMYWFNTSKSFDNDKVEITVINDGKGVEIKVPAPEVESLTVGSKIYVGRLKDAAGNVMAALWSELTLKEGSVPMGTEAALIARDTIVLTIKDAVKELAPDKFAVKDEGGNEIAVSRVKPGTDKDGNTTITFTLSEKVNANATTGDAMTLKIFVVASEADAAKNKYGQTIDTEEPVEVKDACAPEVEKVILVSGGNQIKVVFTEELDADTFASKGTNGFSVSKGEITSVKCSGNVVTINGSGFTKNTSVSYNGNIGITDIAGNTLAAFNYTKELATE